MEPEYSKFNKVDYSKTFARQIEEIHALCKSVMSSEISDGDRVIDLGGGPGIGASLLDGLQIKASLLNLEPSGHIDDIPKLAHVEYLRKQILFKDSFSYDFPWKGDKLLLMSSAHEIALGYGLKDVKENKRLFLCDLKRFIQRFTTRDAAIIISFPGYANGVTEAQIAKQREFNDKLLGHSHPYDEYLYMSDFAGIFPEPAVVKTQTMTLAGQSEETSALEASAVVFRAQEMTVR